MSEISDQEEKPTRTEPLFVKGGVEGEPEKYLGIKPYDLDKFEYSVLKKTFDKKSIWFASTCGATVGFVLIVFAKLIQLAISQKPLDLEWYEIIAIFLGILLALILRKPKISDEEKEKDELIEDIGKWFNDNPKINIHVSPKRGRR
jgi:hypothetical protein